MEPEEGKSAMMMLLVAVAFLVSGLLPVLIFLALLKFLFF